MSGRAALADWKLADWNEVAAVWLDTLSWLSVAAAAVFVVVLLVLRFVPRRVPDLRYALLALVLLRFLVPPSVTSPVSGWSFMSSWASLPTAASDLNPAGVMPKEVELSGGPLRSDGAAVVPATQRLTAADVAKLPWALVVAAVWLVGAYREGSFGQSRARMG